ncbi:hypothetical protein BKA70DRAFT_1269029 [Coprinopsis sp. MPI-PUGE-AT-0042]|nr:hypothetical protein BKA70DRAFT_1269029 [Coprinopsis sp. MPI-PUGE-AT-0042]
MHRYHHPRSPFPATDILPPHLCMPLDQSSRSKSRKRRRPLDTDVLGNMPHIQRAAKGHSLRGRLSALVMRIEHRSSRGHGGANTHRDSNHDQRARGSSSRWRPSPAGATNNHDYPDNQRRHTYKAYQMATLIHEVYGNDNQGPIEAGGTFNQNFYDEAPRFEPLKRIPDIPLDAQGRAHNVIGRVIGNVNSTNVPAGATLNQNFMPSRAQNTGNPQRAPELESLRGQTENHGYSRCRHPRFDPHRLS